MVVAGQDDVRVGCVECVPEVARVLVRATARAEQRDVPIGERADVLVRGEVRLQPLALRAPVVAAARLAALRIERDQVPAGEVPRVVTLRARAGGGAEVV